MTAPDRIYDNDVLRQLFLDGPTWDGNLLSKADRTRLVDAGLVERWGGWNYLTEDGVEAAVTSGLAAQYTDPRWYKKATCQ